MSYQEQQDYFKYNQEQQHKLHIDIIEYSKYNDYYVDTNICELYNYVR